MAKVKVLQTEFWMIDGYRDDCNIQEETPVFNRDGQYLMGGVWWFEIDGKAFTYDTPESRKRAVEQFKHQLSINDEVILGDRELAAIDTILRLSRNPAIKAEARKLWFKHDQAVGLRQTRRRLAAQLNY